MARKNEDGYAHEIQHHRGHVHHVVGPIAPARQESVELAENFLGPKIDATFSGIAMRQLDHSNSLRPEKKQKRNNPEPNRDAAVRSDARHHVEIENGYDKQRDEVPAPKRPLQM